MSKNEGFVTVKQISNKIEVPVDRFMSLYGEYCKYDTAYTSVLNLLHSVLVSDNIEIDKNELDDMFTELIMNYTLLTSVKRQVGLAILSNCGISIENVILSNVIVFDDTFVVIYEVIE